MQKFIDVIIIMSKNMYLKKRLSTKKLLKLISEFSKVARYKFNTLKIHYLSIC